LKGWENNPDETFRGQFKGSYCKVFAVEIFIATIIPYNLLSISQLN